jgi:hypothetical protein
VPRPPANSAQLVPINDAGVLAQLMPNRTRAKLLRSSALFCIVISSLFGLSTLQIVFSEIHNRHVHPAVEACEPCTGRNSRCNLTSRPLNAAPEPPGERLSHSLVLEFFALHRRGPGRRRMPGPGVIRSTHQPESFTIPMDPVSSLPTNLPGSLIRGRRLSSFWAGWPSVSRSSTPLNAACGS